MLLVRMDKAGAKALKDALQRTSFIIGDDDDFL
jgi:hypothetical protein